ncbi:MAG: hypothetical protein ACYDD1_08255 [Caulobacteraceae bacterium]
MIRTATILFALVAMTSAAHAAQPALGAAAGREVINVDHGPGRRATIVRDGGGPDAITVTAQPQVLTYKDTSGALVRVYADHAVSRSDVEAQLLEAERQAGKARLEGRRAAEDGRRAASEGRREAQAALREAAQAREAGLRAAQEGRRQAELGRREAERGRAEGERAIKEAQREMEQLRFEEPEDRR